MRIVCARASRFAPAKGSTVTVAGRQGFDRGVRTHNDDHFLCNHDSFNGHPIRPVAGVECVSRVATLSSNASSSSSSATSHELIASRQPRQHANVALRRYVTGYRTAPRSNCWRRAGISRVRAATSDLNLQMHRDKALRPLGVVRPTRSYIVLALARTLRVKIQSDQLFSISFLHAHLLKT